jgi:ABC-type transporter Mla subunit MlaD
MPEPKQPGPLGDLLRSLQELTSTITAAATQAATAGAKAVPPVVAAPLAEYIESAAQLNDMLTGPLRRLLDEQQQMAERLAGWAEQHRELSEQIAKWAEQHRKLTDQMQQLVRPALEQSDRLSDATTSFVEALRR